MGIAFVAAASATVSNANLVVSKPAGVQQGDILFAMISQYNTNPTIPPSGWTYMGGDGDRVTVCFLEAGAAEPSSYTLATGVTTLGAVGIIAAYRGSRRDFILEPVIDGGIAYSGNEFNFGATTATFPHANSQGTQQRMGMGLMAGLSLVSIGVGSVISGVGWPPSGITSRATVQSADNRNYLYWGDKLTGLLPPITDHTPPGVGFSNSGGSGRAWCAATAFLNREQNKQGGTVL